MTDPAATVASALPWAGTLPWAVALPFVAALLAPVLGPRLGARTGFVLWPAFVPAVALALAGPAVIAGATPSATVTWVGAIGLDVTLRGDGFSLLFAVLVGVVGMLVTLYAAAYLRSGERHGRFYASLLVFGGAMIGLVLSDNLVATFAFWELTSISSFLLIGFWDTRAASRDGAIKALLVTGFGGLALLVAMVLLGMGGGSSTLSGLDLEALRTGPYFVPAIALLLLAAFTKSAQLPFHLWLPTAMEAPTPVSAFLHSATMVKAGVVVVAKFGFLFAGTEFATLTLYVGLATMVWGSWLALRQTDLKALLAYSTVSQLGLLTALYGSGDGLAATAHLVNHAAFKAALFLIVGIVDHEAGSRDITKLSGLGRKMPLTAGMAVVAALSMAGLPPWGGFISKELFYESMLHLGALPMTIAVVGSIMTFAYSIRFLRVFFGPYRAENPNLHAPGFGLVGPVLPLVAIVVAFGLVTPQHTLATPVVALGVASLGVEAATLKLWHGLSPALAWSVLTWFAGAALVVVLLPFVRLQEALTPRWNANTIYYGFSALLERMAERITHGTQGAKFAWQLRVLFAFLAAVGAIAAYRFLPAGVSPVGLDVALVALLMLTGVVGVLLARERLTALVFMGLAGFGSALIFVLLRAPDLALTQLLIETVTVILFLSVFHYLPPLRRYTRPPAPAALDALLAAGVGATVFGLLVAVQTPIAPRIRDFFLEYSKSIGGGYNVVNVILVDFRGYDTMGEITVLAVVAVAVIALLRLRSGGRRPDEAIHEAFHEAVPGGVEGSDDARP